MKWFVDGENLGGMYLFLVNFLDNYVYLMFCVIDEGIFDFKKRKWIFNLENIGVVNNLFYIIKYVLVFLVRIEVLIKYYENILLYINY